MMGTSLNNSSSAAREMDMVLKSEISAHSAYDPATKPGHHGVPVPGKKQVTVKVHILCPNFWVDIDNAVKTRIFLHLTTTLEMFS